MYIERFVCAIVLLAAVQCGFSRCENLARQEWTQVDTSRKIAKAAPWNLRGRGETSPLHSTEAERVYYNGLSETVSWSCSRNVPSLRSSCFFNLNSERLWVLSVYAQYVGFLKSHTYDSTWLWFEFRNETHKVHGTTSVTTFSTLFCATANSI